MMDKSHSSRLLAEDAALTPVIEGKVKKPMRNIQIVFARPTQKAASGNFSAIKQVFAEMHRYEKAAGSAEMMWNKVPIEFNPVIGKMLLNAAHRAATPKAAQPLR